jgi:hypothetical protein
VTAVALDIAAANRRPRVNGRQRRQLGEEQLRTMARRYRAGDSQWTLACDYGFSCNDAIALRLRAMGVEIRPRRGGRQKKAA